ncbi:methyltransferase domain-containing protein [Sinorhizobium meliloti]|nr:methyltransferase domain-containing protein [Sinorhizobium meliloti]RVG67621.1 methyltransferase domain-containing protein [Sinorhizobium meliloti]RVH15474.1 methyltransferase domain-containing protein [Sinorhizobium meliloti]RVH42346.1 methyltransferase domain-containing protein [Sinorhizobium meliloti]
MRCAQAVEIETIASDLRSECPVCCGRELLPWVTFEAIPVLCNALHSSAASARTAETGRFCGAFCRRCTHFFNAAFEEQRIGYTQSYENSLHFSPRFVAFVEALAGRLSNSYALAGKTVIDVGCGKGDFLKRLCALSGATGIGFDKSFEEDRGALVPQVRFVRDWFDDRYADLRPDLVSCRHVIEHIADPIAFLRALRAHPGIGPETIFYFEVPNALYTLRELGIWDLIYEHVSYFTAHSLRIAVEAAGFDVLSAGSSFGDQYLFIEARAGRVHPLAEAAESEECALLVRKFEGLHRDKVTHWQNFLSKHNLERVVVWGAGSKGVTFVNAVPLAAGIGALVDVNTYKQGRFAPGTGTPVLSPESLRGCLVEAIIIVNPIYRHEIARIANAIGLAPEIVVA